MEVIGDLTTKITHLVLENPSATACGLIIAGTSWGVLKKYFWVGQVGCKDCRNELSKRSK